MRRPLLVAVFSLMLAGPAFAGPVCCLTVEGDPAAFAAPALALSSASASFRRCMRQHYGPHYFRGVKRAHRYFMAQACGG